MSPSSSMALMAVSLKPYGNNAFKSHLIFLSVYVHFIPHFHSPLTCELENKTIITNSFIVSKKKKLHWSVKCVWVETDYMYM